MQNNIPFDLSLTLPPGANSDSLCVIAISGGVDSSFAAHLLKKEFPRLLGASHYIWPDSKCCNLQIIDKAKSLCHSLDIPYFLIDQQDSFKNKVVRDFVETYYHGKTPNPCVRCNGGMRFLDFYRSLEETLTREGLKRGEEPIYFATGHYVRLFWKDGRVFLRKGLDRSKDQSYMLYRVNQEILSKCIFPLGNLHKTEVVRESRALGLVDSAGDKVEESQEACFVDTTYTEFLTREGRRFLAPPGPQGDGTVGEELFNRPGKIVDTEGNLLGFHRGHIHYTLGQRKGLGLGSGPWYVVEIDAAGNRVVVGRREELGREHFFTEETVWFLDPEGEISCNVQVRYKSKEVPGIVYLKKGGRAEVKLEAPATISPGQSAVFYQGDIVLGGGIISGF